MKRYIVALCALVAATCVWGQEAPKAVKKAAKAVFSVISYDAQGKILRQGNGVFIDGEGTAISDFSLFNGAASAVTIDAEGVQRPVALILGANELYDGVKFKVQPDKKITYLTPSINPAALQEVVWMVPYSTKKDDLGVADTITELSKVEGDAYYTLSASVGDKNVSCPIVNSNGELLGLLQRSAAKDSHGYALGARYLAALSIGALSMNDASLSKIAIAKALPAKKEDALVYLYMVSRQNKPEAYLAAVNNFIAQFPKADEGYLQRAAYRVANRTSNDDLALAAQDWAQALTLTTTPDNIYYEQAKTIYAAVVSDSTLNFTGWNLPAALELVQKAYTANPLPIYTQLQGNIYFAMKEYDKAFDSFYRLKDTNLASADTYYSAAKCGEMIGKSDTAIALMDSAVGFFVKPLPQEAGVYILARGVMKERAGRYRDAVLDYNAYEKLMTDAQGAAFYYFREQAEFKAKMFQQALDDINRATSLSPKIIDYWVEKARLCYRVNYVDEGLEAVAKAVEINPEYPDSYFLKGCLQLLQKKNDEACANFAKAKSLGYQYADEMISKYCNK